jgi:excisionase family DNA binding protein
MTSLDASAMSPAARLNDSSATATSSDLVRTIASAVVDLVKSEPGLRAELHRVLVAGEPDHDEMLTTHEAADLARVAVGSVRRWVRQGRLRRHRVGRTLRVSRVELECLMRDPGPDRELTPEEQADRDFR